jgi:hypothetical protein
MPNQDNMVQALYGGLPPNPDINEPLAPTEAGAQALTNYVGQQAQHAADLFMAPGRAYQGQLSPEEAQNWGPQMAMALMGKVGAPEAGAAGIFGGRLSKTAKID